MHFLSHPDWVYSTLDLTHNVDHESVVALLRQMKHQRLDINAQDDDGKTALVHLVQHMLMHKAQIKRSWGEDATPRQVIKIFTDLITLLKQSGAQMEIPDHENYTALEYAIALDLPKEIQNALRP